jgi:cellulose synthase/poly-beta-1,6-N-acetylglucosamine synthase-like glycosyltransferase
VLEVAFWTSVALLVYTQLGYPLALGLISLFRRRHRPARLRELPRVTLVIAAYNEEEVIGDKVANALALDYPRELVEVIVASDGSTDRTAELAQAAGADAVLRLPRGGKVRAQDAAVEQAKGQVVAFSDANSFWKPSALRALMAPFADPKVGYACGQVRFTLEDGSNQEGLYWRYEMAIRQLESRLGGVTAGNGAIYAVRKAAYYAVPPAGSHDLSFPFGMVKRGWRAVYAARARAEEKMAPTIEGEFSRKRRMMSGIWDIALGEGMLSPRGYGLLYAFQILSHRVLRYLTPLLHLVAFATNAALLGKGGVYLVTFAIQVLILAAAALGPFVPARPFRVAYYYVTVTASIAAGLWDRLRGGRPQPGWEKVPGTR